MFEEPGSTPRAPAGLRITRRSAIKRAAGLAAAAAVGPALAACSSSSEPSESAGASSTTAAAGGQRVRRNITALSAAERSAFVDAVHAMKETQSPIDPSLGYYDQFVHFHQQAVIQSHFLGHGVAHNSPSFLPWHRKLVLLFEDGLQRVSDGAVTLPYWDWTDESSLAVVFADDLMGPRTGDPDDNYAVTSGPFAGDRWSLNLIAVPIGPGDTLQNCPFRFLTRANLWVDLESELAAAGLTDLALPTTEQVDAALAATAYDSPPYDFNSNLSTSFRCYLEGNKPGVLPFLHNGVHSWVGGSWSSTFYDGTYTQQGIVFVGTLTALDASPNDPLFFLHHCNVDRLWTLYEDANGPGYEPVSGWHQGWNLDDEMFPYTLYSDSKVVTSQGITNASMLDHRSLGYRYEEP